MMKKERSKSPKEDKGSLPVECMCRSKILAKDLCAHVKQCANCKGTLVTLLGSLDHALKSLADPAMQRVAFHIISQAKAACKERFTVRSPTSSVPVPAPTLAPVPAPVPVPVPVPAPVRASAPTSSPVPAYPRLDLAPGEEEKGKPKSPPGKKVEIASSEIADQSSVFCTICRTHYLDFNQIMYLQRCPHAFCKEDLKKLTFKYEVLIILCLDSSQKLTVSSVRLALANLLKRISRQFSHSSLCRWL